MYSKLSNGGSGGRPVAGVTAVVVVVLSPVAYIFQHHSDMLA